MSEGFIFQKEQDYYEKYAYMEKKFEGFIYFIVIIVVIIVAVRIFSDIDVYN